MNKLQEYFEAKKGGFKKTAKRAAITGLVAATILTGAAGLTSCEKDPVHADTSTTQTRVETKSVDQIVSELEHFYEKEGKPFELQEISVIKIDDYYSLSLSELRDNGLCLKGAEYDVSSEFYDKIKEMSKSRKGINILEEDRGFDFGRITISEEAIKNNDNADILGIIFNETKTNGTLRYDEEIPDMAD